MLAVIIVAILSLITTSDFDSQLEMPKIAVENCKHLKKATEKRKREALKVAHVLYQVEKEMNIPITMRGMTLAAACLESGFSPDALGDRKFSKSKKKPMAVGVLQLWKWYEDTYGVNRKDPKSSVSGWLKHIKRQVPKVKKQCRYRSERRIWVAAWVTGIRYKKPGGRCKEKPRHYRYFLKIRKIYDIKTRKSLIISGKRS